MVLWARKVFRRTAGVSDLRGKERGQEGNGGDKKGMGVTHAMVRRLPDAGPVVGRTHTKLVYQLFPFHSVKMPCPQPWVPGSIALCPSCAE